MLDFVNLSAPEGGFDARTGYVRDAEAKIVGPSKIARDITERKRSEAQISILAREAEHRAKNLLSHQT